MRPVFLHSAFRSGSTWFWHRFRECREAYAYCEPFNLQLDRLTLAAIRDYQPGAWASGHPAIIRPYFEEYAPLLGAGQGVALFEPRFGVETYFLAERDTALERYIGMLVDQADQMRRVAVLGFCCSLGRVGWFKRFCVATNIVTWRNPRDQWGSTHSQWRAHGHFHFEVHYLLVAYVGSLHPDHAAFFAGLSIPGPDAIVPAMPLFAERAGIAERFRIFLRVFMLDTLLSVEAADILVEMDRLNASPSYRGETTAALRAASGLAQLSFEDCNLPRHDFGDDADYRALLAEGLAFLEGFAKTQAAGGFARSLPFLRERLERLLIGD